MTVKTDAYTQWVYVLQRYLGEAFLDSHFAIVACVRSRGTTDRSIQANAHICRAIVKKPGIPVSLFEYGYGAGRDAAMEIDRARGVAHVTN